MSQYQLLRHCWEMHCVREVTLEICVLVETFKLVYAFKLLSHTFFMKEEVVFLSAVFPACLTSFTASTI